MPCPYNVLQPIVEYIMRITAPAKINLYLKVLRKRDDGYHEIETLFERVSIFDHLTVNEADETVITCNDPSIPTGENSLLGKTIIDFNARAGKNRKFRVVLEKNIPVGAGLGGGSSDAAALLRGLNKISGTPLENKDLLEIGANLGADIPFFLNDFSFAIGLQRGDDIQEVTKAVNIWHILVKPPFEIATKDIYRRNSPLGLTKPGGVDRIISAFLKENNSAGLAENLHNDLQAIVLQEFPVLKDVLSVLKENGAKGTLVSGSGSVVFGIFDEEEVEKASENLKSIFPAAKNWQIFVAQTY